MTKQQLLEAIQDYSDASRTGNVRLINGTANALQAVIGTLPDEWGLPPKEAEQPSE